MGSSPVTATTSPADRGGVQESLDRFLRRTVEWRPCQPLVVAFSGGPDSTALLAAAVSVAGPRTPVWAAHYDHRLDPESGWRAAAAERLADQLGARWTTERAEPPGRTPDGIEQWARIQRYAFLDDARRRLRATAVLTAHHRRDQAETVLLRMLHGTGLRGLAAIQPWVGRVGRPYLDLSPDRLRAYVAGGGWTPIDDPTNHDLTVPRNHVRDRVLPHLSAVDPQIEERLAALARAARSARRSSTERVASALALEQAAGTAQGRSLDLRCLAELPPPLWPFAVASLQRSEGHPGGDARLGNRRQIAELQRQIDVGRSIEVSLEGGWRWLAREGRLWLHPPQARSNPEPWRTEIDPPGGATLPDGGRLTISTADPEPWMRSGERHRAALEIDRGHRFEVRNRRPGDRLQPLGCTYSRKLKSVLIDAKVPAHLRDHMPLLVVDGDPAWVPGVTIDHRFRMRGKSPLWVAQWHPGRRN